MIHIFVVNSISSDPDFGRRLREHLEKRDDIRYFVFNTTHKGMEASIVEKMIHFFEGERLRFYACGGSGTMRNVMQGTGKYKNVEFAFVPLGQTNDFLKMFGRDADAFLDIDRQIEGHIEQIDYIKTNYGYALNTVSYGLDSVLSATLENVKELDIFGAKMPFFFAYFHSLITTKPQRLVYVPDGAGMDGKVTELIIGNGGILGGQMQFTDDASPVDGLLDYVIGVNKQGIALIKILMNMVRGNISEVRKNTVTGKCSTFSVKSLDGSNLSLNLDGEIVNGGKEWNIEVVKKGMSFVIPRGVNGRF